MESAHSLAKLGARWCRNPRILTGLSHVIPRSIPPYAQTFFNLIRAPLCPTHGLHELRQCRPSAAPEHTSPDAPRTDRTTAREAPAALRMQYLLYTEQAELTISFVVSHSRQVLSPCAAMDVLALAAFPLSNIRLACLPQEPGECLR